MYIKWWYRIFKAQVYCCCCWVAKPCLTGNSMYVYTTAGSWVLHCLLGFAQIHVHELVMLPNHLTLYCPLVLYWGENIWHKAFLFYLFKLLPKRGNRVFPFSILFWLGHWRALVWLPGPTAKQHSRPFNSEFCPFSLGTEINSQIDPNFKED